MAKLNRERREKLSRVGKAAASIAAMTLLPSISYAANIKFGPKDNTSITSLYMDNSGNVGIGSTASSSYKLTVTGNTNITGNTTIGGNVVGSAAKTITGFTGGVWNAVWNDLVEYRPVKEGEKIIPGKVYVATEEGAVIATKRAQIGTIGVCSDTGGFFLGGEKDEKGKLPIGISGWVLAYVDKKYPVGTALVSGPNGVLTKARCLDKIFNAERIVGIVETSPTAYNNIKVDGRYWVKIS